MTKERFDVVIYEAATGRIESIAGEDMPLNSGSFHTAEKRLGTVLPRLNDHFNARIIPTGTRKVGDALEGYMISKDELQRQFPDADSVTLHSSRGTQGPRIDLREAEPMSALTAEIEADRINQAVETIGKHLVSPDALVSVRNAEVECAGPCKRSLVVSHATGIDELIRRLAREGWEVRADDTMQCPACAGGHLGYFDDQR